MKMQEKAFLLYTHGTYGRTWDIRTDMGHKSGHFRTRGHLVRRKVFIMKNFCLWVIRVKTLQVHTSY